MTNFTESELHGSNHRKERRGKFLREGEVCKGYFWEGTKK
jgi:hypothetical protein